MDKVVNIPVSNTGQVVLDQRISAAIDEVIKTNRLTVADIVGVLRVIELRVLLK